MKKIICTILACLSMAACNSSSPESMYSQEIDQIKKEQQRDRDDYARYVQRNNNIVPRNEQANNNRLLSDDEQRELHDRMVSGESHEVREQAISSDNNINGRDRDKKEMIKALYDYNLVSQDIGELNITIKKNDRNWYLVEINDKFEKITPATAIFQNKINKWIIHYIGSSNEFDLVQLRKNGASEKFIANLPPS